MTRIRIALHGSHESHGAWAGLLPAAVLLLSSIIGAVIAGLAPRAGQTQFAVVAAPWQELVKTAEIVGSAGGTILDGGGPLNAIIAHSDDPGFVDALYRAGAWLVLDPVLLRGCLGLGAGREPALAKGNM